MATLRVSYEMNGQIYWALADENETRKDVIDGIFHDFFAEDVYIIGEDWV